MTLTLLSQHPDHAQHCESCRTYPACVLLPTALGWDVAQCQQCWARGLARDGQRVVWRQEQGEGNDA